MAFLNSDQLKIISTICSKLHISKEDKGVMVNGFSAGRCTSSRELHFDEAKDMIAHLRQMQPYPHPLNGGLPMYSPLGDGGRRKMIGKMLSYCREMGWVKRNGAGVVVADYSRLDEWATKYGYLKKKIKAYKYPELPKLVSQFEAVYKSFLNKM